MKFNKTFCRKFHFVISTKTVNNTYTMSGLANVNNCKLEMKSYANIILPVFISCDDGDYDTHKMYCIKYRDNMTVKEYCGSWKTACKFVKPLCTLEH